MTVGRRSSTKIRYALFIVVVLALFVNAEIPAGYAGTPFPPGSAPRELTGRINFNEFDCGAINVSWYADDAWDGAANRNAVGQTAGPAFFCTNGNATDRDTFYADGVMWPNGVRYPDPVDTSVQDCYIGASHPSNFTKWTVHVSTAGKYWISGYWSAMDANMTFTISLLNGENTTTTGEVTLHSVTQSYHAWRRYNDFASIQADTGVQVLYFQNGSMHLNQDYLYFSADSGNFPTKIRSAAAKPAAPASCFGISISKSAVHFSLPDAGRTKVSIFDCLGRELMTVLDRSLAAGEHSVAINRTNLKRGVYFVHVSHNSKTSVMRFLTVAK
jgi:hypothetical protein